MPVQCTCFTCGKVFNRRPSEVRERNYCAALCKSLRSEPVISADGRTASIALYARDGSLKAHTLVDAADAAWVNRWMWRLGSKGYATRSEWRDGRSRTVRLHRVILRLADSDGLEGDHINGDKLDNRRSNLRALSKDAHAQNQRARGRTSKYRGVSFDRERGKWTATIRPAGRRVIYLGRFDTEAEAAAVARAARERLMPFASG